MYIQVEMLASVELSLVRELDSNPLDNECKL